MEETLIQSLENLKQADVANALPHVDEDVLLSFDRHHAAGRIREWYFTQLSAADRRMLDAYMGGGQ